MTHINVAAKQAFKVIGTGTAVSLAASVLAHLDPLPALTMGVGAMIGVAIVLGCLSMHSTQK